MIIDFHTHCFPGAVAPKAIAVLSRNGGNITPAFDGTKDGLLGLMREKNISLSVVLNIATNEKQMRNVNDFAAAINNYGADGGLAAFGSVYPHSKDALAELERIKSLGLPGIKLHPDYQDFFVDGPEYFPIYEKAAELGLITVFHSGVDIEYFEPVHCSPERLAKALPAFGGAPVVAAHMGGYLLWDDVEKHLVGKPVYLDSSYCYSRMPRRQAKRIAENHGADRVLFGSDLPWSAADNEARFVQSWELPQAAEEMILGGNAMRLLGIGIPAVKSQ